MIALQDLKDTQEAAVFTLKPRSYLDEGDFMADYSRIGEYPFNKPCSFMVYRCIWNDCLKWEKYVAIHCIDGTVEMADTLDHLKSRIDQRNGL